MPRRSDIQPKLAFIDGMRGTAALYVVVGHIFWMVEARNPRAEWPDWLIWLAAPFWYGNLAVAAFIVLSGFCLQMSLFDRRDGRIHEPLKFLARRARRILPPYYACLAISLGIAATVTSSQRGMPFSQYLPLTQENVTAHFLLVHNWSRDWMYKINGVLWSIAVEVQLYLLFPLLIFLLFRLGRLFFVAATFGFAFWFLDWHGEAWTRIWYVGLFGLGMVAAHFAYRPEPRYGTKAAHVVLLGILLMGGAAVSRALSRDLVSGDVLVASAVAAWLYAGSVAPWNVVARLFAYKPIVVIGVFSYSLYLMHHPLQQVLYVYRPAGVRGPVGEATYLLTVGMLGILAGCIAFFILFERPFLNKRLKRPAVKVSTRAVSEAAAKAGQPDEEVVMESPARPEEAEPENPLPERA